MSEYADQIDAAFKLHEDGRSTEATAILSEIYLQISDSDIESLGLVGSLFRQAGEVEKARNCFERSVASDPSSVRASLGLFHSLWNGGSYEKGLNELRRFLTEHDSADHWLLLDEMNTGFFGESLKRDQNALDLIERIRQELK